MSQQPSREELMRYLDGELPPGERERLEERLSPSTEARRTLAVFRAMKGDLQGLALRRPDDTDTVWSRVNRRVARPLGWILTLLGGAVWTIYAVYLYVTSRVELVEKLATGAVVVGVLLLLATVIVERYREWGTDPYRHIQR